MDKYTHTITEPKKTVILPTTLVGVFFFVPSYRKEKAVVDHGRRALARCLAVLLVLAGMVVLQPEPAQAASCGDVLVAASEWPGGVDVRHNGVYQETGISCFDNRREIYDVTATPPRWGGGWQCVELAARLYKIRGWNDGLPGVGPAAEIFTKASNLGMTAMAQGSIDINKIVPGDMIVSNQAEYGHVSVASSIDVVNNIVRTVEQNASETGWADYTYSPTTKKLTRGTYYSVSGVVHDPQNTLTNGSALPDGQVVHNLDIPGVHYVAAGGRLFWYDSSLHSAFVNQMHIKLGTNRQIRNMYNSEINLIEANRTNGGTFLARSHMPPDNTFLYEWREIEPEKAPQYVLQYNYAFEITSGEVAFLNGTNKATMIPPGNIQYWLASYNAMPDIGPGRLLKSATSPDFYEVQGGYLYHANNMTVVDCLAAGYKVQNGVPSAYQPVPLTLIQAFLNNGRNAYQLATCQMPDDVVFFGTGGAERWQITGSNPYARRQYASTLAIHCYRGPSPTLREISGGGVNAAAEGAQIHCPNNTYLKNNQTGQVFQWWDGQLHYISSQEMLSCLTQGNTGVVIPLPEAAFGGAPQGAPAQCQFEGKLLQAPNGQVFWVKDGARRYVGNAQILNCLTVRANAGVPVPVPVETVNSYTLGAGAYCTYPADIRFVRGDGQAEVWRVFTNGTRQHAGSLCSPQTDPRYAVHVVPAGEVDGHANIGMFEATPSACAAIP